MMTASNTVCSTTGRQAIVVVAPATLEEDFTFDVMLEGRYGGRNRPYTVTVPKGGVREGEEFEIPYPPSDIEEGDEDGADDGVDDDRSEGASTTEHDEDGKLTVPCRSGSSETVAPYGQWRTPLCSCCSVLTQATFWMSLVCSPVLIAQLLTRLGLSYTGHADLDGISRSDRTVLHEAQQEVELSYSKIVLSFVAVLAVANFIPVVGFAVILLYVFLLLVVVGSNLRKSTRQKYKIAPRFKCKELSIDDKRNGCIEDIICMAFCGCCSLIQIARHTHNDKEYPGYCCTITGLERGAPKIV
jgi:Cys-rich protein (TIGR01571 family)